VNVLQSNSKIIKQQYDQIKEEGGMKDQVIKKLVKELQERKTKEKEYEGIVPKIEELEELQDKMILQNTQFKQRENILRTLIGDILIAVGETNDASSMYIKELIKKACNQL
jgi:hypothetical protein